MNLLGVVAGDGGGGGVGEGGGAGAGGAGVPAGGAGEFIAAGVLDAPQPRRLAKRIMTNESAGMASKRRMGISCGELSVIKKLGWEPQKRGWLR